MVEFFNSLEMRMQRNQSSKVKKKLCSHLKTENRSIGWLTGHAQNVHKELRSTAHKKAVVEEGIGRLGG